MSGDARLWALYTATHSPQTLASGNTHQFQVVARLTPGVTLEAAKAAVSLLLLIARVNVASLLLARAAARRRELAVRLAIGASRGRVIRQLLTESAVLAGIGVTVGLLLAAAAVRRLRIMAPLTAANLGSLRGNLTTISLGGIALDARAVGFSVVVSLAAGLGAGLAPALSAARVPLANAMREGSTAPRVFSGLRRLTPRGALVIAEIALAVVLLVGSGLMVRSLGRLFDVQAGYRPDRLLTARVTLNATRARTEPIGRMWDEVIQRVSSIPGVTSVAVGSCAPAGDHCEGTDIALPGRSSYHGVAARTRRPALRREQCRPRHLRRVCRRARHGVRSRCGRAGATRNARAAVAGVARRMNAAHAPGGIRNSANNSP